LTALWLTACARRFGARFAFDESGTISVEDLDRLPTELRAMITLRFEDMRAAISEHSAPKQLTPADAIESARRIALAARAHRA